jgi:hypothetical protein
MKKSLIILAAAVGIATAAPVAMVNADPNLGCETIHWGFLGSKFRTIWDGPRQPDGSWMRHRIVWRAAHYVPASSSCGTYSCSYNEGYSVGDTVFAKENYVVLDSNVLSDEPGWLPPGTDVLR